LGGGVSYKKDGSLVYDRPFPEASSAIDAKLADLVKAKALMLSLVIGVNPFLAAKERENEYWPVLFALVAQMCRARSPAYLGCWKRSRTTGLKARETANKREGW